MYKKKVVVLGPKFSYSYNLARRYYKDEDIMCVNNLEEVFKIVFTKNKLKGIVPIENMISGSVRESFLNLKKYPVCILRAFDYEIKNIFATNGNKYSKIVSHSQPLSQCSNFINKQKGVDVLEVASTSKAMQMAAEDKNIAAIGNIEAANFYKVSVKLKNISNKENNLTRFVEIAKSKQIINGEKTSLMIKPFDDRAGLLFEILSIFKIKGINLTKIESIPTGKKMNDYVFYLDIEGSLKEKRVKDALVFLRTFVGVKVFGSYNIFKV